MEGRASISADILGRYAEDAALEVNGVSRLTGRRGAQVMEVGEAVHVVLRVSVSWGVRIPEVGRAVQSSVRSYLERMAGVVPSVDVVVDEVGSPR